MLSNGRTVALLTPDADVVWVFHPQADSAALFSRLLGDANGDGQVNATDRSLVVGAWTGAGFTCATDLNSDAVTNATDRSMVVGAWTGGQNCAP